MKVSMCTYVCIMYIYEIMCVQVSVCRVLCTCTYVGNVSKYVHVFICMFVCMCMNVLVHICV